VIGSKSSEANESTSQRPEASSVTVRTKYCTYFQEAREIFIAGSIHYHNHNTKYCTESPYSDNNSFCRTVRS
jgi:uncharacterized protein YlbG (UPF0298 family)